MTLRKRLFHDVGEARERLNGNIAGGETWPSHFPKLQRFTSHKVVGFTGSVVQLFRSIVVQKKAIKAMGFKESFR